MEIVETSGKELVRWRELIKTDHASALVLVCLGIWLHAADGLLVATMMPAIVADIGGIGALPWNIALYEVGSIVSGAASGLLTTRYGVKTPMAVAAFLFSVGCLVSAVAPSMNIVLAGRLLQGFGGGGMMAMSFVSIATLFPSRLTGRVIAVISALWGVASFVGPVLGALFVEYLSWRAGFFAFAGQGIFLAIWISSSRHIRSTAAGIHDNSPFPIRRLLWLTASIVSIAWAGIEVSLLKTTAFVALALLLLVRFLQLDMASGNNRLLPRNPVDVRRATNAALAVVFCFSAATIAIGLYGPVLMMAVHGVSVLTAGSVLLCESVAWSVMAVIVSGISERHDRTMAAIGMCIVATSIACLAWSIPHGPIWFIFISAVLMGCGYGMAWTFILRVATQTANEDDVSRVSGAMPTVQRLGFAFGAAYLGIVANSSGIAAMDAGGRPEPIASAVFAAPLLPVVVGLAALYMFTRPPE